MAHHRLHHQMSSCTLISLITSGVFALCGVESLCAQTAASRAVRETGSVAELQRENRLLKLQLSTLNQSLARALEEKEIRASKLKDLKEQLALFGKGFFDEGDEKLRSAVSDYQVARERLTAVETAAAALLLSVEDYLTTAVAADPASRAEVELKIREFQVALGHREAPRRRVEAGTVSQAKVMTVDSDSGVLVVNAGSKADLRPGMRYRIERSGNHIGDAIVAITRPDVSGLLMQNLTHPDHVVRSGDAAHVILD